VSPYQQFIRALSDAQLAQLARGGTGIGCDAEHYRLAAEGCLPFDGTVAPAEVRALLSAGEQAVLTCVYATQPLCRAEFDYQAESLLATQGAAQFCHHPGNRQGLALMIDGAYLVAVGPGDVRSRYGYFCECDEKMSEEQAAARARAWLASGEAYDDYRGKTTCRYC
jgi:hypothetical protein